MKIPRFDLRCDAKGVPVLKAKDIEEYAERILADCGVLKLDGSGIEFQPIPLEEIVENVFGIQVSSVDFADRAVLGMTLFSNGNILVLSNGREEKMHFDYGTILIASDLIDDSGNEGRLRYTLGHELGHRIFHAHTYYDPKEQFDSLFDDSDMSANAIACNRDAICGIDRNFADRNWIEWQADYFSSCILMPRKLVWDFWHADDYICDEIELRLQSQAFLAAESVCKIEGRFSEFAEAFNVSRQAAAIRLEKLNVIDRRQKEGLVRF